MLNCLDNSVSLVHDLPCSCGGVAHAMCDSAHELSVGAMWTASSSDSLWPYNSMCSIFPKKRCLIATLESCFCVISRHVLQIHRTSHHVLCPSRTQASMYLPLTFSANSTSHAYVPKNLYKSLRWHCHSGPYKRSMLNWSGAPPQATACTAHGHWKYHHL